MYRQIAEGLRGEIDSGVLEPGQQLPTESELQDRYNASRNTVREAIRMLMSLGLVETRPGQGTFVTKKMDPFVTTLVADARTGDSDTYNFQVSQQKRKPFLSDVQLEIQKADAQLAARLAIPEGSQVISRHQRRFIDDTPWSFQTSFYPRSLAAQGAELLADADDIKDGAVKYLARTLGLQQVGYRDLITVRTPNTIEATFFNLPLDGRVAVYEIFRTAYDQTGTAMRVTVTVFPTDRNQFTVEIGAVPDDLSQPGKGDSSS
jgi:GntR family transcriptional regulator